MKLRINNLGLAYCTLCNMHLLRGQSSSLDDAIQRSASSAIDSEREEGEDVLNNLRKIGGISHGKIEMPYPFNFADFYTKRVVDSFSATIVIGARNPSVFKYSSSRIKDILKRGFNSDEKRDFVFSTEHGSGYVINPEEKDPLERILFAVFEDDPLRHIGIGNYGTKPIGFPRDLEEFELTVRRLERVANLMIEAWYSEDFFKRDFNSLQPVPEDLVLHINCV